MYQIIKSSRSIVKVKVVLSFVFFAMMGINHILLAQDENFSQYFAAPMTTNPAMLSTSNQFQLIFNYRNQFSTAGNTFVTPMVSFISPIFGQGRTERLAGVGVAVVNNQLGDGILSSQGVQTGISFNLPVKLPAGLPILYDTYISFGVQGAYYRWGINPNNVTTASQIVDGVLQTTLPSGEVFANTTVDFLNSSAGFLLYSQDSTEFIRSYIGFSVHNINQPSPSFLSSDGYNKRPIAFSGMVGADVFTIGDDKLIFHPSVRWLHSDKTDLIQVGTQFRYQYAPGQTQGFVKQGSVSAGIFYSNQGGIIVSTTFQQLNFNLGISYDLSSTSVNSAPSKSGAFEISLGVKFGNRRLKYKNLDLYEDLPTDSLRIITPDSLPKFTASDTLKKTLDILPEKNMALFEQKIPFFYATDDISLEAERILNDISIVMSAYPDIKIAAIGHACDIARTSEENNLLSLNRAEAVRQYLFSRGVRENQVQTEGQGDTQPVAPNTTEEGRAKNRRVEFKVLSYKK